MGYRAVRTPVGGVEFDLLVWKRHRPAPPPGHPMRLSYGWPGGGVGRCRTRFSGAESDSSTPPPLPTSPPAAISKRMDVPPTGERIALAPLVARVPIGRASCRERVGQYVWISVVAVPLK